MCLLICLISEWTKTLELVLLECSFLTSAHKLRTSWPMLLLLLRLLSPNQIFKMCIFQISVYMLTYSINQFEEEKLRKSELLSNIYSKLPSLNWSVKLILLLSWP